ncbi:MAG: glycosyltransferase family 2 protein [Candidatus Aquirickettsiella sp.]
MENFYSPLKLSVIVPVYKEEKNIIPFLNRIQSVLQNMKISYEILFCLDPSPDMTEIIIRKQMEYNSAIKLILLSRKFGQPAATIAGILHCEGETCVVIDVDLQDPPELIKDLYLKLHEGFEVVYATRRTRQGEPWIKKIIAYLGYMLIAKLSEVPIPRNTGDFRIMTRRVIEELRQLHEKHGFLRGLVAFVGFRQTFIEFDREPRLFGKSNYNRYVGALKLAINGLISFSTRPLQIMSIMGFFIALFGFVLGGFFLIQKVIGVNLTPGLSATILTITFFSGMQLLFLGLMGEYVGRIYEEVKRRPMYIIDAIVENKNDVFSELIEKIE